MNDLLDNQLTESATTLVNIGRQLYSQGWVPATSGNFSARLDEDNIAITVSGTDKGQLQESDIMPMGLDGTSPSSKKSSAETGLHLQLYRRDRNIGAVLHTHSLNATLVSMGAGDQLVLGGLELLKAFHGIDTHEASLTIPVFDNDQDIDALAHEVERYMQAHGQGHAYLIRGHGLYTWGRTMKECLRHLEALEYLLDYWQATRTKQTS